jgi:hypothetical protein
MCANTGGAKGFTPKKFCVKADFFTKNEIENQRNIYYRFRKSLHKLTQFFKRDNVYRLRIYNIIL